MAALLADDFTGTDGTVWNPAKWALGHDPVTGGGATIQSNVGRLSSGSTGGYSPADRIARRLDIAPVADLEIRLDFELGGEVYPWVFVRAANELDWAVGCYAVSLSNGPPAINLVADYASTVLAAAPTVATGVCSLRFRAVGTTLQARIWPAGTSEPAAWNIGSVTHAGIAAAGYAGIGSAGGAAPASQHLYVNNVTVTDGAAELGPLRVRSAGSWVARKVRVNGSWAALSEAISAPIVTGAYAATYPTTY